MMEDLPLDTSNPAVRDYLALIRHVFGSSPGYSKPDSLGPVESPGIQVAGVDTPKSAGEYHGGPRM